MANKTPPAHDFAPAWLKIPTYNSFKPSGASSERGTHTSRKDDYGYTTHHKDNNSLAYHSYFNNDCHPRKDHHRNEVNNVHYYGVENSFNESQCNGLSKRPHSRHDFRISLSYKQGDNTKQHMTKNGGFYKGGKGPKHHHHQDNSNGGVSNGGSNVDSRGITTNNFNQEFPSLQGDVSEESTSPPALNGSAWEKPRSMQIQNTILGKKLHLVKKTIKAENLNDSCRKISASSSSCSKSSPAVTPIAPKAGSASNCRALIPSAKNPVVMKKPPALKEPSIPSSSAATLPPTPKLNIKKTLPSASSTGHSMEILVKHPKAPGNKSDFLKTLRTEKKDDDLPKCLLLRNESVQIPEEVHHQVNGSIDISKLSLEEEDDKEKSILSSSLEAEERLLREMGWKEEVSDDESYAPLTEAELREFRDRTQKIQKKNGYRRNLLSNLSPLRMAPFPTPLATAEVVSSDSSSDSDDP